MSRAGRFSCAMALALAFGAAQTVYAATATTTDWIGGEGGSESEPFDIYQAANWSRNVLPSQSYNLNFTVSTPTYLTNSYANATSTMIADTLRFNSGDFVLLGPFRFYTLNNTTANATASVVKKGDWWIDYFFCGGSAQGSKTVLTNEYGNMTVDQQADSKIASGEDAQFDIVSKAGNWSFSNGRAVYFAHGQNSNVRIEKEGGDWTFSGQAHFGRGTGSTARLINKGGNLSVANYFIVGSGGTGYLDIEGGEVMCSANYLGVGEAGPGTVTVKTGGKFTGSSQLNGYTLYVGNAGTGMLNVEGGEVSLSSTAGSLALCLGTQDASVSITDGGLVTAPAIKYGSGAGRATMTIDNGTIKALMDNAAFIPANNNLFVYVGSNGGTIDANGKTITIAEPLLEDSSSTGGGMTFKGGGTVSLASGNTYTGATVVELGTTVEVSSQSDIPVSIAVSIPEAGLAPGRYTILKRSGQNAFTSAILDGIAAKEDCEFALADGGKTVVCVYKRSQMAAGIWLGTKNNDLCDGDNWSDGAVPNGAAATISCAVATTLVCNGPFSPSGITFPAASALVTISGPGTISGISSIVNNTSLHHVFNCAVVCADGITPTISRLSTNYMTFAGGITMYNAPKTGGGTTATEDQWSGKINITTADMQDYKTSNKNWCRLVSGTEFKCANGSFDRMAISLGATAVVERLIYNGCTREVKSGKKTGYSSLVFDNGNGTLRAGEIKSQVDCVLFHSYGGGAGRIIIVDRLVSGTTKAPSGAFPYPRIFLNCGLASGGDIDGGGEGVWAIGPGGLDFSSDAYSGSYYEVKKTNSGGTIRAATLHSFADWKLHEHRLGANQLALAVQNTNGGILLIDTDHFNIGEEEYDTADRHTVTLEGKVSGGTIHAAGKGSVVFANAYSDFTGGVVASNGTTVAVNAGCKPGKGAVLLHSGATLALPQIGNVSIPGAVTLQEDSMLEFHVDGTDSALLTLSSAPALPESGKVTVKLTADSLPKVGASYTLTSGADLENADKFKLADGVQGSLSVNGDGELVYTAPEYFFIRIADSDLNLPMEWIVENGVATVVDSIESVTATLAADGANGIPRWQSYCLGLEPTNSQSVVLCDAAETQPSDGKMNIVAKNLNVPAGLEGVAVTAYLDSCSAGGEWIEGVTNAPVSSGTVMLTTPELGEGLSFFV